MVRHVVMWKLAGTAGQGAGEEMVKRLRALEGLIPGLTRLSCALNQNPAGGWDAVLITEHPDWEALKAYQIHPEHQKAAGYVKTVAAERAAVDYEVEDTP